MAVRTFVPSTRTLRRPPKQEYSLVPRTLGEHIRKARIERGLQQGVIVRQMGLSKDCLSLWETGAIQPTVSQYPKIIEFLGYYPFAHETETTAGKLRQVINCNGWSHARCARELGLDGGTVKRLLRGQRTFVKKDEAIALLWSQLPEYARQQYRSE